MFERTPMSCGRGCVFNGFCGLEGKNRFKDAVAQMQGDAPARIVAADDDPLDLQLPGQEGIGAPLQLIDGDAEDQLTARIGAAVDDDSVGMKNVDDIRQADPEVLPAFGQHAPGRLGRPPAAPRRFPQK